MSFRCSCVYAPEQYRDNGRPTLVFVHKSHAGMSPMRVVLNQHSQSPRALVIHRDHRPFLPLGVACLPAQLIAAYSFDYRVTHFIVSSFMAQEPPEEPISVRAFNAGFPELECVERELEDAVRRPSCMEWLQPYVRAHTNKLGHRCSVHVTVPIPVVLVLATKEGIADCQLMNPQGRWNSSKLDECSCSRNG